jgi:hypothetical protein
VGKATKETVTLPIGTLSGTMSVMTQPRRLSRVSGPLSADEGVDQPLMGDELVIEPCPAQQT